MSIFRITAPNGICCPFDRQAEAYWHSVGKTVTSFYRPMTDAVCPIVIEWEYEGEPADFTLTFTSAEFGDTVTLHLPATARSAELFNLYKAATYTVCLTANGGKPQTVETAFSTADFGPRVIRVPQITNFRDCGGYAAGDRRVRQGLLYRGSTLTPTADFPSIQLTEEGKHVMLEQLGIRTEIDLRTEQEAASPVPPLPIDRFFCTINGYLERLDEFREGYRRCFALLADPARYPVYVHCTGGADRTGTIAYLLGALLGVEESELIKDYEFTSFSFYSVRDSREGTYHPYFKMMKTALSACDGDTLQQQVECLLLSIGVTAAEIAAIRTVLLQ